MFRRRFWLSLFARQGAEAVWAAGYNVLAIPWAAGVLAWTGLTLSPRSAPS